MCAPIIGPGPEGARKTLHPARCVLPGRASFGRGQNERLRPWKKSASEGRHWTVKCGSERLIKSPSPRCGVLGPAQDRPNFRPLPSHLGSCASARRRRHCHCPRPRTRPWSLEVTRPGAQLAVLLCTVLLSHSSSSAWPSRYLDPSKTHINHTMPA